MKIAVFAHIRHAIAEPFMGGMEAHCRMLCDGLRASGHDVTLFAAAGSRDAQLFEICDAPYDSVLPWAVWRGTPELAAYQREAFARGWAEVLARDFDVVHNNSLCPAIIEWAARDGVPLVTSQHVPPFGAMRDAVIDHAYHPGMMTTVTSHSQLEAWDPGPGANLRVVHNGIRCDQWIPAARAEDHFVWVGRITPNKGTGEAARAARMARAKLKIVGPVEDARYFMEQVEPHLTDGIEYHGHRTTDALRPIVAQARGALVTPLWDEPFGLVAAEALSCGTPVCAYGSGALAEVVGDCGFIVPPRDIGALAVAMGRIDEVSRRRCRQRVLTRYSVPAMIEGYQACYRRVVDTRADQAASAFASSQSSTTALLA
ncbi:glycosyltransferase [Erythrobacter sp.]|jgi:glycosyltransferase involved in cell wall biosynthesis|uniref:glycosyltransferase n=1 Tax=Erythrobacter sp. TaxID=1042 RepID=UPI002EB97CC0|nr:glycosyltransferase [Erythrobacter sp.]